MLIFAGLHFRVLESIVLKIRIKYILTVYCDVLTLIEVLVSIACLYFRGELIPQAMQLPLNGLQAGNCSLEETWLNDAHLDAKVAYISPEMWKVSVMLVA